MQVAALKDTELDYSNVTEALYSEWLVGTGYTAGNKVYVTLNEAASAEVTPHKIYEALGSTTGDYPPDNPSDWSDQGATNKWKMFDGSTTSQTSFADEIITLTDASDTNVVGVFNMSSTEVELSLIVENELITDGDCSSDSFTKETGWTYDGGSEEYDCSGAQTGDSRLYQSITLEDGYYHQVIFTISNYSAGNIAGLVGTNSGDNVSANGTYTQIILADSTDGSGVIADVDFIGSVDDVSVKFLAKHEVIDLSLLLVADYYEYFFSGFNFKQDLIWYYPKYGNSTLRTTIKRSGADAECGLSVTGASADLGLSEWRPTTGIIDYSIKTTDSFGNTILSQGDFAKRVDIETSIQNADVDGTQKILATLRGTPALYDCNNDESSYESLIIYGYYEKFDIMIPNVSYSVCNIRIQGLS